jgi:AcrR family transcriptional regulator
MVEQVVKQPRRAEILDVATVLFKSRGYHGTGMDDIANTIGLNKATIYHYYDTKSTLLFDLCMNALHAILGQLELADEGLSAADALRYYIHSQLSVIASNQARAMVYFQESPFLGEWLSDTQVAEIREKEYVLEMHLRHIMERGVRDGTFGTYDTRLIALAVSGMTNWFCRWYHPDGAQGPDEIADELVRLALDGLVGPPPQPHPKAARAKRAPIGV